MARSGQRETFRTQDLWLAGRSLQLLAALLGFLVLVTLPTGQWYWSTVILLGVTAAIWLARRVFLYPGVDVVQGGLVVRNPFASTFVGWDEVAQIEDASRMRITKTDGAVVSAWAVQQRNLDAMRGSPSTSPSGAIVEALRERVESGVNRRLPGTSRSDVVRRREGLIVAAWFAGFTVVRIIAIVVRG